MHGRRTAPMHCSREPAFHHGVCPCHYPKEREWIIAEPGRGTFPRTMFDNDRVTDLRPRLPSPLQEVADDRFARHGVRLLLKRDD